MQTLDELRKRQKTILLDFKAREHKAEKIFAKIAEYEKAISKLQKSLSLLFDLSGETAPENGSRVRNSPEPKRDAGIKHRGDGTSQKERVLNILVKAGQPMNIPEIIEVLQNEGYVFQAKKPVSALTVLLYGNKTLFKKVRPGTFEAASSEKPGVRVSGFR
ncbi:MAG: hypothetical protein WCL16_08340 [bacterium]